MKSIVTIFVVFATFYFYAQEIHSDYEANSLGQKSVFAEKKKQNIISRNPILKSASCSNTSSGTIQLVACSDVGTSSFSNLAMSTTVDYSSGVNWPATTPACFSGFEIAGNWSVYDLAPGVSSISVIPTYFAEAGGAWDLRMTFYQGTDCNNLTEVSCDLVLSYVIGIGWVPLDPVVTGLNDAQKLWVFTSCDDWYNLDVELRGFTTPTNSTCSTSISQSTGCNAGASGQTSWTGPNNNGVTCSGGTWYSNENTVFYTFTATSSNATLEVQNVICNDGTNGEAQFAVWESCGDVGDYNSGFLGCAVGAGTLTMPTLTIGQSYVIVADGQAGDVCAWDFVSTGIVLPVEFITLNATSRNGYNEITWSTLTEINADYFAIEKSIDGVSFQEIGFVDAVGTSQERVDYSFVDDEQNRKTVYYRLRQVDLNGDFVYQGPVFLDYSPSKSLLVYPNPVENIGELSFFFKAKRNYQINLMDVNGRILFSDNLQPQSNVFSYQFPTEHLENGMYFVVVSAENGEVFQSSFLKK